MTAMLYGIDHASHQGLIDMQRIYDLGHRFEIGKCTGEGNYVNLFYQPNHQRALAAGLVTGSYDWVEPQDARPAKWLAEDYLRVVDTLGGRPAGHLLTVDFETKEWFTGPRGYNIEPFMKEYLYRLKEISGQEIIVYTAPYFLAETGAENWVWLGQDFHYWIAAPGDGMRGDNEPWTGPLGPPWKVVKIHQHQWHARDRAIGTGAEFDRNRFAGSIVDLGRISRKPSIVVKEEVVVEEFKVGVPPEGKWSVQRMPNGNTVMVLNFGGQTPEGAIINAEINDVGVTVPSNTEAGVSVSMSFRDEVHTGFQENRGGNL